MAERDHILVICGPTASGKTAAALQLARTFPIEIVSADSRQVIKHLDIGTAKPTAADLTIAPCHLINLIEPGERYSAFRFLRDAEAAIDGILSRGAAPVVVGGTGLYLSALTDGVIEIAVDDGGVARRRLEDDLAALGPDALHERLRRIDPQEAARVHPHNSVRVIRALEIFELTGQTKSHLIAGSAYNRSSRGFDLVCLAPARDVLYAQINQRVDQMMQAGLLSELQDLIGRGLRDPIRRASVIGYQELLRHLEGEYDLDRAVELMKQNTRRYAKRQMTWFRHHSDCRMYQSTNEIVAAAQAFLSGCRGDRKNLT